jgi:hypothetical protein
VQYAAGATGDRFVDHRSRNGSHADPVGVDDLPGPRDLSLTRPR